MGVVVRKATKEDMPEVLELIKELAVFEKQPNAVQINVDTLLLKVLVASLFLLVLFVC